MREIKFRAFEHNSKKMIYNVAVRNGLVVSHTDTFYKPKHKTNYPINQFTGMYDKDDKQVYEGDILEVIYYNHTGKNCKLIQEVYYLEESGCFCVRTVGKEVVPIEKDRNNVPLSWTSQPNTISYLGNIHENPELLTQHKN